MHNTRGKAFDETLSWGAFRLETRQGITTIKLTACFIRLNSNIKVLEVKRGQGEGEPDLIFVVYCKVEDTR